MPIICKSQTLNSSRFILANELIKVYIDLPGENFVGSRFDWTGKIAEVYYKGIPVTTTEKINGTDEFIYGKGLYNEFGIETPIGFDDIEEGESFHKIGIGLLKKEGQKYEFYKDYEIKPAEFTITEENNKIIIECISEELNGYAYILKKEIELSGNDIIIKYWLKNTGKKTIKTDEYTHNFLAFNNELMGEEYILTFSHSIKKDQFWANVNPEDKVEIGKQDFSFNDTPKEQFFFANVLGKVETEVFYMLTNTKSKIGITEKIDFIPSKVNLWGWKHVISPELFFEINLEKGEEVEWTRSYRVFDLDK